MPVWHETTKDLQENGSLQMLGIIQEQHPDRARLFMQWKQMDWPLMVDSLDQLEVGVVPIHLLIDESGTDVGMPRGRSREQLRAAVETFLATPAPESGHIARPVERPDLGALAKSALNGDAADAMAFADAATMWGESDAYNDAIEAYQHALSAHADDGDLHFHLGVAYRKRFDSDARQAGDFANAIDHWSAALEINPNQYIWRRRIQQYGPRLDKPYSFYDWVHEAREAIASRGETPAELSVEPGGAEFAYPARRFESAEAAAEPDPDARIARDKRGFIHVEVIRVANTGRRNVNAARIHVLMTPNEAIKAHWNNEAEPLTMWLTPPDGWQVDARRITHDNPAHAAATGETRRLEFEINPPEDIEPGTYSINAYALYNVCEDVDGVCLYRRQDIPISIAIE